MDLNATALFLDLDGTLAPIEEQPDLVVADPIRTEVLTSLDELLDGRLAVLSGRQIHEVDRILEGVVSYVGGQHGLERRMAGGALQRTLPHPGLEDAAIAMERLARAQYGLLVERKSAAVAMHYRAKPECGPAVIDLAHRLARTHDLELQEGRMVAELRTPGPNKGDALEVFMATPPFAGARPIMIGDDLTDESAFAAAISLGGDAILVGPARPSLARWRLPTPAALLAWLADAIRHPGELPFAEPAS
ncbi:MAG: otsB [Caulobacter sp.]|nr:otsB [Caulobacter sp.]